MTNTPLPDHETIEKAFKAPVGRLGAVMRVIITPPGEGGDACHAIGHCPTAEEIDLEDLPIHAAQRAQDGEITLEELRQELARFRRGPTYDMLRLTFDGCDDVSVRACRACIDRILAYLRREISGLAVTERKRRP